MLQANSKTVGWASAHRSPKRSPTNKGKTLLFLKKKKQKDFCFFGVTLVVILCVARAAPAQEQQIDPARLQAAEAIATATGGADRLKQTFAAMRPGMIRLFVTQQHMAPDQANQFFDTVVQPGLQAHVPELLEARAKALAGVFTVPELNQIRDFYVSPVGKKYIANEAGIATSMMMAMQPLMRDMVQRGADYAKTHPPTK